MQTRWSRHLPFLQDEGDLDDAPGQGERLRGALQEVRRLGRRRREEDRQRQWQRRRAGQSIKTWQFLSFGSFIANLVMQCTTQAAPGIKIQ